MITNPDNVHPHTSTTFPSTTVWRRKLASTTDPEQDPSDTFDTEFDTDGIRPL
jgi:hypothetical protein